MINDIENVNMNEKNLSSRFRLNIHFNVQQKLKNEIDELKLFMIYNKLI